MDDNKRINTREGYELDKLNIGSDTTGIGDRIRRDTDPARSGKMTVPSARPQGEAPVMAPESPAPDSIPPKSPSVPVGERVALGSGEKAVSLDKIRNSGKGDLSKDAKRSLKKFKPKYVIDKDNNVSSVAKKTDGVKNLAKNTARVSVRRAKDKALYSVTKSANVETEEGTVKDHSVRAINRTGEKTGDAARRVVKKANNKIRDTKKYGKTLKDGGKLVDKAGNVLDRTGKAAKLTKKEVKGLKSASKTTLKKVRGTAKRSARTAKRGVRAARKAPGRIRRTVRAVKATARTTIRAVKAAIKVVASILSNPVVLVAVLAFLLITAIISIFMGGSDSNEQEDSVYISGYSDYAPVKPKKEVSASEEELIIWKVFNEYFEGNQNVVVGIMCNIQAESGFIGKNLEGTNNLRWGITDDEFTTGVNTGSISKEDFCKSTYNGDTKGYYNSYGEWANEDGGYGIAQFTAYTKKKELYEYAVDYFKDSTFDIGNAEVQARYLCTCLDSDYSYIKDALLETTNIEEACTVWLKLYEIPEDPYNDGYVTLGKERAKSAAEIIAACSYAYFTPRIASEGTGLTLEEANKLSDWYGSTSPYANVAGFDYSVAGHHGNCVSYAWGRRCEIEGEKTSLRPYTAYAWYHHAVEQGIYQTGGSGSYLKPGMVVCWGTRDNDDAPQHVAIIEKITRDEEGNITEIITGNSSFNQQIVFYNDVFTSQEELENSKSGWYGEFQGYIYLEKISDQ